MKSPIEIQFPRILPPPAAVTLDVLRQLRAFERRPRAEQEQLQGRQLRHLLGHAHAHSPFWRQRLDSAGVDPAQPLDLSALQRLPPLTRSELQDNFESMRARLPDWTDAGIVTAATSGSTGQPVRVEKLNSIYAPLQHALSLLDHERHRRDARKTLGGYGPRTKDTDTARWGAPQSWFGPVGKSFGRNVSQHTIPELYAALEQHRPAYVSAAPPVVQVLAQAAEDSGRPAPQIEQILTYSARVTPELRALARKVFGARVVDRYSCEECGQVALQCTKHDHYHVTGAACVVEIVDAAGRPSPPGRPGRMLITALHSYAMPLIRYEIGDLAVAGGACDCGLASPVIARILGRVWDLVTLPDGQRRFAPMNLGMRIGGTEVREHQILLYSCGTVEVLVRCRGPLTEQTRAAIVARVHERLGPGFPVHVREAEADNWLGLHKRREFDRVDRPYSAPA